MTQKEIDKAFEGRWRIKSQRVDEALEMMPIEYRIDYVKKLCMDFFNTGVLLGEGGNITIPTKSALDTRAEKFYNQVHAFEFTTKYPQQLLLDFYNYWSEPNRSKTKMRFELQKTWDIARRLATWARNDFNHYGNTKHTIEQQRLSKLADLLTD